MENEISQKENKTRKWIKSYSKAFKGIVYGKSPF
jgi:hypothetical protein